jgi:hypothetical protein
MIGVHIGRVIGWAGCIASAAVVATAPAASAPPTRFDLPAGTLRLSESMLAAGIRARLSISVTLDRRVRSGRRALTLPRLWTQRAAGGVAYASLPRSGRASSSRVKVTRVGRELSFAFTNARKPDAGRFEMRDNGIPAGTYRLAYRWREGGRTTKRGTARVVFVVRRRG